MIPWIRASASWLAGCVPWCHLGCILGPSQPIEVVESVGRPMTLHLNLVIVFC